MKTTVINTRRRPGIAETAFSYVNSPIGIVEVGATGDAVLSLKFVQEMRKDAETNPMADRASAAVGEYFDGTLRQFDLPILLQGRDFQICVWLQLLKVCYGTTASYGEIATGIGNAPAARAVGLANGKNPISLIVPCHRIIGSNGSLTGYGGGLWRKEWLLKHERAIGG